MSIPKWSKAMEDKFNHDRIPDDDKPEPPPAFAKIASALILCSFSLLIIAALLTLVSLLLKGIISLWGG